MLTDAGRAWAEDHPDSLIANVALQDETAWPSHFHDAAVKICNEAAAEAGYGDDAGVPATTIREAARANPDRVLALLRPVLDLRKDVAGA